MDATEGLTVGVQRGYSNVRYHSVAPLKNLVNAPRGGRPFHTYEGDPRRLRPAMDLQLYQDCVPRTMQHSTRGVVGFGTSDIIKSLCFIYRRGGFCI